MISKASEREKLLTQTQQRLILAEGLAQQMKIDMDRNYCDTTLLEQQVESLKATNRE